MTTQNKTTKASIYTVLHKPTKDVLPFVSEVNALKHHFENVETTKLLFEPKNDLVLNYISNKETGAKEYYSVAVEGEEDSVFNDVGLALSFYFKNYKNSRPKFKIEGCVFDEVFDTVFGAKAEFISTEDSRNIYNMKNKCVFGDKQEISHQSSFEKNKQILKESFPSTDQYPDNPPKESFIAKQFRRGFAMRVESPIPTVTPMEKNPEKFKDVPVGSTFSRVTESFSVAEEGREDIIFSSRQDALICYFFNYKKRVPKFLSTQEQFDNALLEAQELRGIEKNDIAEIKKTQHNYIKADKEVFGLHIKGRDDISLPSMQHALFFFFNNHKTSIPKFEVSSVNFHNYLSIFTNTNKVSYEEYCEIVKSYEALVPSIKFVPVEDKYKKAWYKMTSVSPKLEIVTDNDKYIDAVLSGVESSSGKNLACTEEQIKAYEAEKDKPKSGTLSEMFQNYAKISNSEDKEVKKEDKEVVTLQSELKKYSVYEADLNKTTTFSTEIEAISFYLKSERSAKLNFTPNILTEKYLQDLEKATLEFYPTEPQTKNISSGIVIGSGELWKNNKLMGKVVPKEEEMKTYSVGDVLKTQALFKNNKLKEEESTICKFKQQLKGVLFSMGLCLTAYVEEKAIRHPFIIQFPFNGHVVAELGISRMKMKSRDCVDDDSEEKFTEIWHCTFENGDILRLTVFLSGIGTNTHITDYVISEDYVYKS